MEEVYEVVFSSPELLTVADYVADPGSPAFKYINREEEFLNVKNTQGKTNREIIISRIKDDSLKVKYQTLPAKEFHIKLGTVLAIPVQEIDKTGLLTQGIEVVSNNIPAFKARALAELESKEGYNPARKTKPIKGVLNSGILSESYPEVTVWVWCRALSSSKLSEENNGEIFNVTPFVQNVTTNVGKNGGNFQISLPPLSCEIDSQTNSWIIKKSSLTSYQQSANNLSMQKDGYVASSSLLSEDDQGNVKRSQFLFHNILSTNDVVFIRFETLDLEKDQRIDDGKNFIINKDQLPGKIYDMIGLIDENSQTVNAGNNDVTINISGRDLSKLFIEDGTYFYALEMSQGQLNFAGGSTQRNELMQRVFSNNALQYFNLYYNNSIENVLKFVIQQLSTIKIVPNNLFEHYGDRRNTKYNPEQTQRDKQPISDELQRLKKQCTDNIASLRKTALLQDISNVIENKHIERIWSDCYSFMKSVRFNKVRQTLGTLTNGWSTFDYISNNKTEHIEQNTFPKSFAQDLHLTLFYSKSIVVKQDEDSLFINIDRYLDLQDTHSQHKDLWKKEVTNGIWQIVKLVIDEGITNRRLVDSSASSANGSLLNFIRKVCQEPFVEFYMDTYGDMYHLIARRPPTDFVGIDSMLSGQVSVESDDKGGEKRITSTVINIAIEDVIQEQLIYDDRGAISWYQLTPQANFIGNSSTYSLAYLPAIFFEEYADIWGSRPLQITHNYMPHLPLNPQQSALDISEQQAFEDLAYIVESNAYIPFTRRGMITTNGDRRFKIGNICRYEPTGEVFFIDDVQQNFQINENSIDRTTILTVSRGMIESVIYGIPLSNINQTSFKTVGYFNIINTDLNLTSKEIVEVITETVKVGEEVIDNVVVNDNIYSDSSNLQTNALFAAANRYKGYRYGIGENGVGGRIDCSGFVSKVLQIAGFNVNRDTSENIMTKSNNFRQVSKLTVEILREGDVIGFDTGKTKFDDGRMYGIDHIAIVVKNYNSGKLELAESVGGVGVRFQLLEDVLSGYNNKSKKIFIGDFRTTINDSVIQKPIYETRTRNILRKEINRAKVFSNFKVFKECFNFLLRKQQNSIQYSHKLYSKLDTIEIKKNN